MTINRKANNCNSLEIILRSFRDYKLVQNILFHVEKIKINLEKVSEDVRYLMPTLDNSSPRNVLPP